MAKSPTKRKPQQSAQQGVSRAFVTRKDRLGSHIAQKVYGRSYNITAESLYSLGIMLRIVGTEEQAKEAEKVVDEMLTQVAQEIETEKARLEKLLDDNGITGTVQFTSPQDVEVQISSPRGGRYFGIIRALDDLIGKLTALWISGVIADAQYSQGSFQWQRRVLKAGARIQNISKRAIRAAGRKQVGPEEATEAEAVASEEVTESAATKKAAAPKKPAKSEKVASEEPKKAVA